ncbi:tetratricopeptide repeat protein [Candidatus Leptofilum sp.]|uniref:tetratricopeptide repeat protein n=1 Tax=Candidatus Leptofilum sp. TaxID=3241576 RepID=UPI003B5A6263
MIASTFDQQIERARIATQHGRFWDAVDQYTQILAETDPQTEVDTIKNARLISLKERGDLLSELGEQVAALAAYEQYYLEAGSSQHAVEALVLIGNRSRGLGQYGRSLKACQEALDLSTALNYTPGRAKALAALGGTYLLQGGVNQAASYLNQANALFEQLNDIYGQVQSNNQMGIAHATTGHLYEAIHAFEKSLALARKVNRRSSLVSGLNNLGECYQLLYATDEALACHREGLALAEVAKFRLLEADLCRNLGLDLAQQAEWAESHQFLQRAYDLAQEIKSPEIQLHTLYALARVAWHQGDAAGEKYAATLLAATTEPGQSRWHRANGLFAAGLFRQMAGNHAKAEEMWQQAIFLAHEIDNRVLLWQLHAALARIAQVPTLANVHNRIAAEVIQQIAEPFTDEALKAQFLQAPAVTAVLNQLPREA